MCLVLLLVLRVLDTNTKKWQTVKLNCLIVVKKMKIIIICVCFCFNNDYSHSTNHMALIQFVLSNIENIYQLKSFDSDKNMIIVKSAQVCRTKNRSIEILVCLKNISTLMKITFRFRPNKTPKVCVTNNDLIFREPSCDILCWDWKNPTMLIFILMQRCYIYSNSFEVLSILHCFDIFPMPDTHLLTYWEGQRSTGKSIMKDLIHDIFKKN
jgi:hypothetical protein